MTLVYDGVDSFKRQGPLPKSLKKDQIVHVVIVDDAPKSRTAMGADLRAIRARIVASGVPLLTREEVLKEVHSHRGGYSEVESRE
jgi:response regulator RpfG family c-di-GMP phosphodiesterase